MVLDRVSTLKILKYRRDLIIDRMNKWNGSLEMLEVIVKDVESLTHHADLSQPFSAMAAAYIEEFENHLEQWRKAQGLPPF
ncbi:hypothetical protein B0920_03175 [Massilia sp. KIM]|nr:hypothetical protein B0920_03175 [Massilia sp. KIM]